MIISSQREKKKNSAKKTRKKRSKRKHKLNNVLFDNIQTEMAEVYSKCHKCFFIQHFREGDVKKEEVKKEEAEEADKEVQGAHTPKSE